MNISLRSTAVDCGGPIKIPTEVWLRVERRPDEANGGKREREGAKAASWSGGKTYCVFIQLLFQCQGRCTVLLFVAGDGSKTQPNLSLDQRNTCGRSRECCLQIQ